MEYTFYALFSWNRLIQLFVIDQSGWSIKSPKNLNFLLTFIKTEYRGARREKWTDLSGGWFLTHLTLDLRFPNSPRTVETIPTFTPPRNDDNFYGQRLQAYFVPPISGNYTFYASCDSECVFYLSSDEMPENKKEVIRIDQQHRTEYEQWER